MANQEVAVSSINALDMGELQMIDFETVEVPPGQNGGCCFLFFSGCCSKAEQLA
ncbi:MAG: hypothetical protein M1470_10385 [Bacteroidetes bacterium]|nr:hypothetical protein [Bacteroidota bacterium]